MNGAADQRQPSASLLLTLQVLCLADARGLADTIASIEEASAGLGWDLEVQLVPLHLSAAGTTELTLALGRSPQVRCWQGTAAGEAAALNAATPATRGCWIWRLEAGDRLAASALENWSAVLRLHPQALVIAADGDHLDQRGRPRHRHGVADLGLPPKQVVDADLYCPGALSWKRSLELRLPPLREDLSWAYREAWLLQALEEQRQRWITVEEPWVSTHRDSDWQQAGRCRARTLEWTQELQRQWGEAPLMPVQRYALALAQGEACIDKGSTGLATLEGMLEEVRPLLGGRAWRLLQQIWGLDAARRPWQERVDQALCQGGLLKLWCVELLRNLLYPELHTLDAKALWGPRRLAERLISAEWWSLYRLLRQDPDLIRLLNHPVEGLPLIAVLHWLHQPELQEAFPLNEQREQYAKWWQAKAGEAMPHIRFDAEGCIDAEPMAEDDGLAPDDRPFGVNLIGHAYEVFGIGEDVRMAALAMESAGIPFCVIHVPAGNGAATSDRSLEGRVLEPGATGPYRFNLVCMAAPSHGAWIAREGLAQQRGRTTIVAWPWETQTWPQAWECMIPLADAFWPSSTFTAKALEPFSDPQHRPLQVMPMAVHIDHPEQYRTPEQRQKTRARWNLDPSATLVLFVFDVKSSLARKNPWGAMEAFQRAFPRSSPEGAQLVIKALRPENPNPEWDRLVAQAGQDSRIYLISEDLTRTDLLALIGCCDVFLSLHRSEGFGRGIAEAAILGIEVVASAFGGNTDFYPWGNFHMVNCSLTKISRDSYPNAEGHRWAEPEQEHASRQLTAATRQRTSLVNRQLGSLLHPAKTGRRYLGCINNLTSNTRQ